MPAAQAGGATTADAACVLGVDPGLTRCGLAILAGPPSAPRVVATELVSTAADVPIEQRLAHLHDAVCAIIGAHAPTAVAVERVLFSRNVRTAMATGQAAGVVLLAAAQAGLPVWSYSPNDVKLTVTGDGAADKDGVARMVALQLGLSEIPTPADVADALAVALTHLGGARLAAATGAPVASGTAGRDARQGATGGWEAAIAANPNLRIAGGTR